MAYGWSFKCTQCVYARSSGSYANMSALSHKHSRTRGHVVEARNGGAVALTIRPPGQQLQIPGVDGVIPF